MFIHHQVKPHNALSNHHSSAVYLPKNHYKIYNPPWRFNHRQTFHPPESLTYMPVSGFIQSCSQKQHWWMLMASTPKGDPPQSKAYLNHFIPFLGVPWGPFGWILLNPPGHPLLSLPWPVPSVLHPWSPGSAPSPAAPASHRLAHWDPAPAARCPRGDPRGTCRPGRAPLWKYVEMSWLEGGLSCFFCRSLFWGTYPARCLYVDFTGTCWDVVFWFIILPAGHPEPVCGIPLLNQPRLINLGLTL